MTRAEHMRWCKARAHEAYKFDVDNHRAPEAARRNAIASMLSDLGKHPETEVLQATAFAISLTVKDEASLFYFIDGFAE